MAQHHLARRTASTNTTGIVCMCAGVLCLVLNDSCAKWLGQFYAVPQIVFFRTVLALPVFTLIAIARAGSGGLKTPHPLLHIGRGILATLAAYCFFLGLTFMPLAEATAIVFSAPLFITSLSILILKEHVGSRRWAAVITGFLGVLIIIRPGGASFQPAALIVVGTAVLYALQMITVRMTATRESVWTFMFYMTLVPFIISAAMMPFLWQAPQLDHLPAILGIGLFGATAFTLMTQAFLLAPAAVVAPFDYTALIWATLIGWLLWNEVPGPWTTAGALCIALAGIYVIWREARVAVETP